MKKKLLEFITIHLILIFLLLVSEVSKFRICIFFNTLGIPCYGCGITRGILSILNGDVVNAIRYNYLSIVIFLAYLISLVWIIIDIIRKKDTFSFFLKKYRIWLIFISIFLIILAQIINLNNRLLY